MLTEHEIEIRVRYQETDGQGRVHHANYFTYFELGRTELLRAAGFDYRRLEALGFMLVVHEISCTYHQPAAFDDLLRLRTITVLARGASRESLRSLSRRGAVGRRAQRRGLHQSRGTRHPPAALPVGRIRDDAAGRRRSNRGRRFLMTPRILMSHRSAAGPKSRNATACQRTQAHQSAGIVSPPARVDNPCHTIVLMSSATLRAEPSMSDTVTTPP